MSEAVYSVHANFVCKQPRSKSDFKKKQQEIFLIRFQADAEKPSAFGNHFRLVQAKPLLPAWDDHRSWGNASRPASLPEQLGVTHVDVPFRVG